MAKILPISEVKAKLPELVNRVQELEDEIIVTRNGKPAAMLVSYADYERMKETLDVLSDPELMRQIRRSEAEIAAGKPGVFIDEGFGPAPQRRKRKKRG